MATDVDALGLMVIDGWYVIDDMIDDRYWSTKIDDSDWVNCRFASIDWRNTDKENRQNREVQYSSMYIDYVW
jgi:hypothetical protein